MFEQWHSSTRNVINLIISTLGCCNEAHWKLGTKDGEEEEEEEGKTFSMFANYYEGSPRREEPACRRNLIILIDEDWW